jgi:AcrR family transcriptional regulator
MRPLQGAGEPAYEDLTARARIRDAALAQFAEFGAKETTIRGIAEAAGVSSGLVQYHFGSKEALREACDAYAFDVFRRTKEEAHVEGGIDNPNFLAVALRTGLPVLRYLARALVDGSPGAVSLFDELVSYTEQALWSGMPGVEPPVTDDRHTHSAVLTAMQLGVIVLHSHLSRTLGADTFTPETYPRLLMALLEIHSHALVSPEIAAAARDGLKHFQAGTPIKEDGSG